MRLDNGDQGGEGDSVIASVTEVTDMPLLTRKPIRAAQRLRRLIVVGGDGELEGTAIEIAVDISEPPQAPVDFGTSAANVH